MPRVLQFLPLLYPTHPICVKFHAAKSAHIRNSDINDLAIDATSSVEESGRKCSQLDDRCCDRRVEAPVRCCAIVKSVSVFLIPLCNAGDNH
jgi:hypothetical protein